MAVRTDVLVEVLVNLVDYSQAPPHYFVVRNIHSNPDFERVLLLFLELEKLAVEVLDFWRHELVRDLTLLGVDRGLVILLVGFVCHLQFKQFVAPDLVSSLQILKLPLVFRDGNQQLRVPLFSRHKAVDQLVDILQIRGSPDLLECLLQSKCLGHFVLHLLLDKGSVGPLDQEFLSNLHLVLVFVFINCHFSNFNLPPMPVQLSPQHILLVAD